MNNTYVFAIALATVSWINEARADIIVHLGSALVDVSAGNGTVNRSIGIVFENPMDVAAPLAGYGLFLDIGPLGRQLPPGVTFASPAATYFTGLGVPPLIGAANPGTIALNPAAGDLGLGQIQLFDASIGPSETFTMVAANLQIDLSQAEPGDYAVILNPDGQNSLNALGGPQPFSFSPGTLRIVPEANAFLCLMVVMIAVTGFRFSSRFRSPN